LLKHGKVGLFFRDELLATVRTYTLKTRKFSLRFIHLLTIQSCILIFSRSQYDQLSAV